MTHQNTAVANDVSESAVEGTQLVFNAVWDCAILNRQCILKKNYGQKSVLLYTVTSL